MIKLEHFEGRELLAMAQGLLEQSRRQLVPRVEQLRRLAHTPPGQWAPTDGELVRVGLLHLTVLAMLGRL